VKRTGDVNPAVWADTPLVIWAAAGLAMVVYAMALPERYDVACGAYAFALVVMLAATGGYTTSMLGFQEHLPENVRLGSASRLDFRMSCYKNNSLEALQSLESIDKYAIGHGDIGHRVAKNPVKMTRVSVLILN